VSSTSPLKVFVGSDPDKKEFSEKGMTAMAIMPCIMSGGFEDRAA
jgi:hypothetical protein